MSLPRDTLGFPSGAGGKEPARQSRRHEKHRFNPWVGGDPLEKGMATHSSTLAWRIPWTEEPGRLQPMGSQRVRPNWSDWAQHHALTFGKPTFTFPEFSSVVMYLCTYGHLWRPDYFRFPVENILSQIQLWRTMRAQAKLQNIWLNLDSITGWIWNMQVNSGILNHDRPGCLTQRVIIYPCSFRPLFPVGAGVGKQKCLLEPKTKTWPV